MKKKIPLIIHQALEKFVLQKDEVFKVIDSDNYILKVVDNDPNSDFYFNIERIESGNNFKITIDYKPHHIHSLNSKKVAVESNSLSAFFEKWLELIEQYRTINTFYDDPIVDAYTKGYYDEFEIIEEDSKKPLKINQILFLDEYLENIEENIEKHATEKNIIAIQEIKNDVIALRENLTTQSKAWVAKKLAKIWGKLAKQGPKFIKEFISEFRKEVIKSGVKFLTEQGPEIIKTIGESLS